MERRYLVISQGVVLSGYAAQDVYHSLLEMKLKPDQARALLSRPIVIKRDLDNPKAMQYLDVFSKIGLKVKIEAYNVEAVQQPSPQELAFALLEEAFKRPIQPTTVTREYQSSVILALFSAVIAPLVYATLVAVLAFALGWYVFKGHSEIFGTFSRPAYNLQVYAWAFLLIAPSVIGSILLLFLLYPLWPEGRKPAPHILNRKQNPRFYWLTEQMAQAFGVPPPEIIELTPDVNAAAAPVKGLRSLRQGRLKLEIGLSLVAGSTVQELAGIIAHEFGHFSQRKSMLVYFWINTVTQWLSQCAHGQDFWHHRIEQWHETYGNVPGVDYTLQGTDYALDGVRTLFEFLLEIHIQMTGRMSQQMEFDADLYEAKVVGSHRFRESSLSLRKLAYAESSVTDQNFEALERRDKLLKNIPAAVADVANRRSSEILKMIDRDLYLEQTEYWDSHPADIERIEHVERTNEPEILSCGLSASLLFNDFEALCEKNTMHYYFAHGIHGAREFVADNDHVLNCSK